MLVENVKPGMIVCNGYLEHVKVVKILEDRTVACSDGHAWEAEDLDLGSHTYRHITE